MKNLIISGVVTILAVTTETMASAMFCAARRSAQSLRINGPNIFGVRPGAPLLYKVPAVGAHPLTYEAAGLPASVVVNPHTGIMTGRIDRPGTYQVLLKVSNPQGVATRNFRIIVGDRICLTPPLGWNSWNCWGPSVSQKKVLAAAKAMVATGLRDHGWTYVNIDDGWQGQRGGKYYAIQPNEKFPDIKQLCDEIHRLGLKVGIYSTPWTMSYAGFCGGSSDSPTAWAGKGRRHGKYTFEEQDAKQWAEWGVDYLKYDWQPNDIPSTERMAAALRGCGRDIVYSIANAAPIENASHYARLANCYRTGPDIRDAWRWKGGFAGIAEIWEKHPAWQEFCGPGHYPDPDMLVVGHIGWGEALRPTALTTNEQFTHITLWCLWSAPMLVGCDLEKLDDFTISLLTNDEVLSVHQDALCIMGRTILNQRDRVVIAKPLEDGCLAVGLFNRGDSTTDVRIAWNNLGLEGPQHVRDLWQNKDLGVYHNDFSAQVPPHGVMFVCLAAAD